MTEFTAAEKDFLQSAKADLKATRVNFETEFAAEMAKRDAERNAAIAKILEQLGVAPECKDSTYTAHPLLAGALRAAVTRAYEAGMTVVARQMLQCMLADPHGRSFAPPRRQPDENRPAEPAGE